MSNTGGIIWMPPAGFLRWGAALMLAISVLSIIVFCFAILAGLLAGRLPATGREGLVPYFLIPSAVAIIGYGFAALQVIRRWPALNLWLCGLAAHVILILGLSWVNGAIEVNHSLSWENWQGWVVTISPGLMIFFAEQELFATPPLPPRV